MLENDIYKRVDTGEETITAQSYNLLIGLVLLWGFFVNYLLVKFISTEALMEINFYVFIIGYFASCLLGMSLFTKSSKPMTSFLGYNLVVIPFGLILNMVISTYDPDLVLNAIVITAGVTLIMIIMGTLFPRFFEKISGALTIALVSVLIIELIQVLIFKTHLGLIDWIVAIIFCGYIGYDWGRANRMVKTVDNAIDGAAAIYMDIINLFLRILRILGRNSD